MPVNPTLQWRNWFRRARHILQTAKQNLWRNSGSHTEQMVRGSVWVFADYGLEQILSLVRSIALARWFLDARDFGILNIASLLTAALLILTETGLWPALIQRKELSPQTLYTSWWIFAVRGLLLAGIVVVVAPLGAWFYEEPLLIPVLNAMALQFVIGGLNSLSPILLQRDMNFRLLTFLKVAGQVVNLLVTIGLAFMLRNIWAVIWGQVATALFTAVFSYVIHDFRPKFEFVWKEARSLIHFSKFITLSGIVTYLTTQGDDAYVGKVLGTEPLGYYGLAYRLSNLPATSLSHVINRVTLPAFSQMQDDIALLRQRYFQTLHMASLLAIPLAGGMCVLAKPLVGALYGEKWLPIVPSFMVLCAFGLERAIGSIAGPVFLALNKPKMVWWLGLSKLLTMLVCIVPLTRRYGILGTSLAVTFSAVVIQCLVVPSTARLLQISMLEIFKQLTTAFGGTLLMMGVLVGVQRIFIWPSRLGALVVLTLVGLIVYAGVVIPREKEFLYRMGAMFVGGGGVNSNGK